MSISVQFLPQKDNSSLPVPFTKFEGNISEHFNRAVICNS